MMKSSRSWMVAGFVAGVLCVASVASAQAPTMSPAPIKGETVVASQKVTATVTKIDQKTREVTLKTGDGEEYSFVAGDAVKNLAQVKAGDVVTATYTEALAYEVKKGGKTGAETALAAEAAPLGAKPAGTIAQQTTVTVKITAIDPKVPSVTFMGPAGNTRTIKVKHPEKLQGVNVGDMVELVYTEALAISVEKGAKK
jgi:Cu/Ag efflux protein CusF